MWQKPKEGSCSPFIPRSVFLKTPLRTQRNGGKEEEREAFLPRPRGISAMQPPPSSFSLEKKNRRSPRLPGAEREPFLTRSSCTAQNSGELQQQPGKKKVSFFRGLHCAPKRERERESERERGERDPPPLHCVTAWKGMEVL